MRFFHKNKKNEKKVEVVYLKYFTVKQILESFKNGEIKIKSSGFVNENDIENFIKNKIRLPYFYCVNGSGVLTVITNGNFIIKLIELSKEKTYDEIFAYLLIDFVVVENVSKEKLSDILNDNLKGE